MLFFSKMHRNAPTLTYSQRWLQAAKRSFRVDWFFFSSKSVVFIFTSKDLNQVHLVFPLNNSLVDSFCFNGFYLRSNLTLNSIFNRKMICKITLSFCQLIMAPVYSVLFCLFFCYFTVGFYITSYQIRHLFHSSRYIYCMHCFITDSTKDMNEGEEKNKFN